MINDKFPWLVSFLITTFSCFFPLKNLLGQTSEPGFFNYTMQNGLPSNLVYGSIYDNDGILWICTDAGVIEFDGINSKLFTSKQGLPSNDVYHLFCDSKNRIWFTTLKNEIAFYKDGVIHNKYNDPTLRKYSAQGTFPTYFENKYKELFILTSSPLGLAKIKDTSITRLNYFSDKRKINYKGINTGEDLFLISDSSIFKFNFKTNKVHYHPVTGSDFVQDIIFVNGKFYGLDNDARVKELNTQTLLQGGYKYLGRKNSIFYFGNKFLIRKKNGIGILENSQYTDILSKIKCSHFGVDNPFSYWISTFHNGIIRINNFYATVITPESDNNKNLCSIAQRNNFICNGTENGQLLLFNPRNSRKLKSLDLSSKSPFESSVLKVIMLKDSIYAIDNNSLYITDYSFNNFKKIKLEIGGIKNFYFQNNEFIFLHKSGITFFDFKGGYRNYENYKRGYCYIEYNKRKVIGTQDSLLYLENGFKSYKLDKTFTGRITDLKSNGNLLFVSTADNGLYIIKDDSIISNFNCTNGLTSNNCSKLFLEDNEVYICSDNGISILDYKQEKTSAIFESDGLASNMVNDIAILNDTIYAATEDGLSIIPISSIQKNKQFNLFAKPYIANADTVWQKPQSITTRTNKDIVLVLNGVSYIKNTKKTYYYRIKELDSNFKATLDKNILLKFSNTGHFTFEAYCLNAEGTKSKFLVIPIYIKPYFYQTIWFYLALLALLLAIIFFVSRYYANLAKIKEQKKAAEEKRIRSLELAAWRSSVNPHFLFNSLNGLQAFFRQNEFDKGNFYLSSFTQMLRNTVDSSNDLAITVEEEIEFLRKYLEFEQNKREKIFNFIIDVDQPKTLDLYIPTLLVQQVLENCVKHAFLKHREGFVHIHFFIEDDKLVCTIRDNGPGLQVSQKQVRKSLGISLIRYKLRILEKILQEPTSFSMQNIVNQDGIVQGLETIFKFPILTKRLKIVEEVEEEQTDGKDTEHDDQHAEEQHAP